MLSIQCLKALIKYVNFNLQHGTYNQYYFSMDLLKGSTCNFSIHVHQQNQYKLTIPTKLLSMFMTKLTFSIRC